MAQDCQSELRFRFSRRVALASDQLPAQGLCCGQAHSVTRPLPTHGLAVAGKYLQVGCDGEGFRCGHAPQENFQRELWPSQS